MSRRQENKREERKDKSVKQTWRHKDKCTKKLTGKKAEKAEGQGCKVGTRTQRQEERGKEHFPDKRVRRRHEDTKTRRQDGKGNEGEIIKVQGCQGHKEDTRKRLEDERRREQKWTRVTAKAISGQAQGKRTRRQE